jgi:hypothetical protein
VNISRPQRPALILAAAAALLVPGAAVAGGSDPVAPPAPVVDWQTHLAHMQAMPAPFGAHIADCVAMHGSLAGKLGPNGVMVEMMGEMVLLR